MTRGARVALWILAIFVAAAAAIAVVFLIRRPPKPRPPVIVEGAVIRQDPQPDKEAPISDVEITAGNGSIFTSCKSDAAGFFKLVLPSSDLSKRPVAVQFRHPGYHPLDLDVIGGSRLYIAKMIPTHRQGNTMPRAQQVRVSNISVRYSVKTTTALNVGSTVRTFQVVNVGNTPCGNHPPCSPDGKWKAASGSISLDAGEGNVFHNVRVSCIAGPCPFTRIKPQEFSHDQRTFKVNALNWSDTATFLVEAEVFHPMSGSEVRHSYPVIFGRVLDFTLPASAEGVCIEADVGGSAIIFPLDTEPDLPWADCHVRLSQNKTAVYRCELAPGYRF